MKRLTPLFAIIVMIAALAFITKSINKTGASDEDDNPPPPKPAATQTHVTVASDPLPAEMTIGNPATAQYKVVMGWVYDDGNQASPDALTQSINAVKQWAMAQDGKASAEIVNLDVPASELSPAAASVPGLGVSAAGPGGGAAGGKEIALPGNPGEGEVTAAKIVTALAGLTAGK